MERSLTIIVVIGVVLFLAVAISLAVVAGSAKLCNNSTSNLLSELKANQGEEEAEEEAICLTPECVHTASQILEHINPEVEPCDDFYEFACGGFVKSVRIPDGEDGVSVFTMLHDKITEELRASVEEPSTPNEPRSIMLAKNFYRSCMNSTAIEAVGLKPLKNILRKFGEWPVLEKRYWNGKGFSWVMLAHNLKKFGYTSGYIIDFDINVDKKNNSKRMLSFQHVAPSLPLQYLSKGVEDPVVEAYFKYMVDVAVILGAERQTAIEELRESLEFEIKLANISLTFENQQTGTDVSSSMTVAELKKQFPSVNWVEFINNLLPSNVRVDADELVMATKPEHIRALRDLLRNTSSRVQGNYIMWRVVDESITYLSKDMIKLRSDYLTVRLGETEGQARWKQCLGFLGVKLPVIVNALYIRNHFKESTKMSAVEMVSDIVKETSKVLEKAEWIDEKTRIRALEKAASLTTHIAYPDEFLDDEKLDEYFSDLELTPDDFLGNSLNVTAFTIQNEYKNLRNPVNKNEWINHGNSAAINTVYIHNKNSIKISAGILQGMFFRSDRPRYMNYGAIGSMVGGDIMHGFNDVGSQFDKDGNSASWWTPGTKLKAMEKSECIINKFVNYMVEPVDLKSGMDDPLREIIADIGGLKVAYLAYKEWITRNGTEPKLPGLEYTPEQMYWISFAQPSCVKVRPGKWKIEGIPDLYSLYKFKIFGPVSEMPEFATDFNCPVGSAMNPKQKCSVW